MSPTAEYWQRQEQDLYPIVCRPVSSLLGHGEKNTLKFITYIIYVRNSICYCVLIWIAAALTATNCPHDMNFMFITCISEKYSFYNIHSINRNHFSLLERVMGHLLMEKSVLTKCKWPFVTHEYSHTARLVCFLVCSRAKSNDHLTQHTY